MPKIIICGLLTVSGLDKLQPVSQIWSVSYFCKVFWNIAVLIDLYITMTAFVLWQSEIEQRMWSVKVKISSAS